MLTVTMTNAKNAILRGLFEDTNDFIRSSAHYLTSDEQLTILAQPEVAEHFAEDEKEKARKTDSIPHGWLFL